MVNIKAHIHWYHLRVHHAGVDIAQLLQSKQIRCMFSALELLVN